MKKIKKLFSESSFVKALGIIRKNKNVYLYTIVLDMVFLAFALFIGKYIGSLIPADAEQIIAFFKTRTNLLLFVFVYPVLYYLFVILMYSTAKLIIMGLVRSLYEKSRLSLKGLLKFYWLNIIMFIIIFVVCALLFGALALLLQKGFLAYTILALSIPLLFFSYSLINIAHTLFIKNQKARIIRRTFGITFRRIPEYGAFILWDAALILLYFLLYNVIHFILKILVFTNEGIVAKYGSIYISIFNISSLIFIYLVIAINRIYFYGKIGKNVLQ